MEGTTEIIKSFSRNYDKLVQELLEGITSLNIRFNMCTSETEKKHIRLDLAILEELLRLKTTSHVNVSQKDYKNLSYFIQTLVKN